MSPEAEEFYKMAEQKKQEDFEKILKGAPWENPAGTEISEGPGTEKVVEDIHHAPFEYNKNNGVLALTTPEGSVLVTPWTADLEKQLTNAGFSYNQEIMVPYSRGDNPTHPDIKKRWAVAHKEVQGKGKTEK